jgi:hypothetical protein
VDDAAVEAVETVASAAALAAVVVGETAADPPESEVALDVALDVLPFLEPHAASTAAAMPVTMKPRRVMAGPPWWSRGFMASSVTGRDERRLRIR